MARSGAIGAIVLAGAAALAPLPAGAVERFYSNGIYPPVQRAVTGISNAVPFALLDLLIIALAAWWGWALMVDLVAGVRRRRLARVAGSVAFRTLTLIACAYLAFLAVWGLNYRRVPLPSRLVYNPASVTEEGARKLAARAAGEVNGLYSSARPLLPSASGGAFVPLRDAFARAQSALGAVVPARPSRPKHTLLEPYFQAAGVDGLTDPFFLETLLPSDLLPFELPFIVAHEWSHLAGYGDEGEANFVGWLTCMMGDAAARYSGWLFLYREAAGRLRPEWRSELAATLEDGPRADLRAINERLRRGMKPAVSAAGWRVYDGYLKANRVDAGTASYAEVVRLVLGTRFSSDWVPQRQD